MKLSDKERYLHNNPEEIERERVPKYRRRYKQVGEGWGYVRSRGRKYPILPFLVVISLLFLISSITIFITTSILGIDRSISSSKIDIVVQSQASIFASVEVPIKIRIANRNLVPIEESTVIISYPEGSYLKGSDSKYTRLLTQTKNLGAISSGGVKEIIVNPVFFGNEGERKDINISFEYLIEGSVSSFESTETHTVKIKSSPVNIFEPSVSTAISGRDLAVSLNIKSNGDLPSDTIFIKAIYPFGFRYKNSTPETIQEDDDEWALVGFNQGEIKSVSIIGDIRGEEGVEQEISFEAYISPSGSPDDRILVGRVSKAFSIQQSFISADIAFRKDVSTSVLSEEKIEGAVVYSNREREAINGVVIRLSLDGTGLNKRSIRSDGIYDPNFNAIIWSERTNPELSSLRSGEKGSLPFSFEILPSLPGFAIENKSVNLSVSVEGTRTGESSKEFIDKIDIEELKVRSILSVEENTLYLTSRLKNEGPLPPKVGEKTTYALSFFIKNDGNDLSDINITIPLSKFAEYTKVVSGVLSGELQYDENSNIINLSLSRLDATSIQALRAIEIQVSVTPSPSEVGKELRLTEGGVLTAQDTFTGELIFLDLDPLTTYTRNEPNGYGNRQVVE